MLRTGRCRKRLFFEELLSNYLNEVGNNPIICGTSLIDEPVFSRDIISIVMFSLLQLPIQSTHIAKLNGTFTAKKASWVSLLV